MRNLGLRLSNAVSRLGKRKQLLGKGFHQNTSSYMIVSMASRFAKCAR